VRGDKFCGLLTKTRVAEMFLHQSDAKQMRDDPNRPRLAIHFALLVICIFNSNGDLERCETKRRNGKGQTSLSRSPSILLSLIFALPMTIIRSSTIRSCRRMTRRKRRVRRRHRHTPYHEHRFVRSEACQRSVPNSARSRNKYTRRGPQRSGV
jgi:hypothetical protein